MNERFRRFSGLLFLLPELAFLPLAVLLLKEQHPSALSAPQVLAISMTFGSIVLCIIMAFTAMRELTAYPKHTFLFEWMVFLCCLAAMTDYATRVLDAVRLPLLNLVTNTVFYLAGMGMVYVILLYELLFLDEKKPSLRKIRTFGTVLMLIYAVCTLLNIPLGFFFTIDAEGRYRSAPTFWLAYIPMGLVLVTVVIVAARNIRRKKLRLTFRFFWVFAAIASFLAFRWDELTVQYAGYTLSILALYLNIQSDLDAACAAPKNGDFVK